MDLTTTTIASAISLTLFVAATWQARRKREPGKPALMPWMAVQFVAAVGVVVFAAHLVSLLTGVELKGRLG